MLLYRSLPLPSLLLLLAASGCHGYGGGAPDQACGDLTPQHQTYPQSEADFPYMLEVTPTWVKPGGRVTLTINPKTTSTPPIKGFFVQSRNALSSNGADALGQFVEIDTMYKAVTCNGNAASGVTHSSPQEKKSVSVTWQAPDALDNDVVFLVTVVQQKTTYWAAVKSKSITLADSQPEPEPTAEPEPEPTAEPEPEPNPSQADKDGTGGGSVSTSVALVLIPLAMATLLRLQ